jgi:P protein
MEAVLARVEWSTLLFFAALFVLMEALGELGLIDWIGRQTENIILSVGEESRLAVAILIILWVSALASAFVDNIPLTTMMVKIAISLAENEALNLPLQPLVWSLAFGACLGGKICVQEVFSDFNKKKFIQETEH